VSIVILGTDAVLAASPATPVQLAHACLRAGFANVVPTSWGDELIAAAVLRRLPHYSDGPAIQCSCPIVAHRLLTVGGDLRPVLLPVVSPPVAVARYVRALAQPMRVRITYVGACPGAVDDSIDIRMTPDALLAMLMERDIVIEDQPHVFESVIPPDRRRYRSQPGGVPSAEALWTELGSRTLVEVETDDFITEVAQLLLTGKNVLIDPAIRLGCACSGAVNGVRHPRSAVVALEPPRSTTPVVDEQAPVDLDLPVPAVSRTPIDVVAVPPADPSLMPPGGTDINPGRVGMAPSGPTDDARGHRSGNPIAPRSVLSAFPVARDVDGKSLPRAYVVRRRSPKSAPEEIVDSAKTEPPAPQLDEAARAQIADPLTPSAEPEPAPRPAATSAPVPSSGRFPAYTPEISLPAGFPRTPSHPFPTSTSGTSSSEATPANRAPPEPATRRSLPNAWRLVSRSGVPLSRAQIIGILIAIIMIVISVSTVVTILVGRSVSAPLGR
jgi:hypothetical protein